MAPQPLALQSSTSSPGPCREHRAGVQEQPGQHGHSDLGKGSLGSRDVPAEKQGSIQREEMRRRRRFLCAPAWGRLLRAQGSRSCWRGCRARALVLCWAVGWAWRGCRQTGRGICWAQEQGRQRVTGLIAGPPPPCQGAAALVLGPCLSYTVDMALHRISPLQLHEFLLSASALALLAGG